jgi:hypothetical protein
MPVILGHTPLSLAEANRRAGYDDAAAVLGELAQEIDLFDELIWFPASHGSYNKALKATRLGAGSFTQINGAVPQISSKTDYVTEPVKLYEGDSIVDERVLKGAEASPYEIRDSEDALNMEGLIQHWIFDLFYNDPALVPDGLRSFNTRRSVINGINCHDNLGAGGDTSSIWIFEFGKKAFSMVHNTNGTPGFTNEDRGRHRVAAPSAVGVASPGEMWAWIRHYEIWGGINLRHENALQRVANIETAGAVNIFDPVVFLRAKARLPRAGKNAVAFCNRALKAQIDANAYNKANIAFSLREVEHYGPITYVADVPVRMIENLLDTEAEVL